MKRTLITLLAAVCIFGSIAWAGNEESRATHTVFTENASATW